MYLAFLIINKQVKHIFESISSIKAKFYISDNYKDALLKVIYLFI